MNYTLISQGLRNVLKTRNVTYKEIALKLNMSESGVKKMLTADDIGFNKLNAVLDLLKLNMEDLAPLAAKPYRRMSEEQETFFLKHPNHFNFFIQLHHSRMNLEMLKKTNRKISKAKTSRFLEDLIKIEVIEDRNGNIQSLLEEGFHTSKKLNELYGKNYDVVLNRLKEVMPKKWKA